MVVNEKTALQTVLIKKYLGLYFVSKYPQIPMHPFLTKEKYVFIE